MIHELNRASSSPGIVPLEPILYPNQVHILEAIVTAHHVNSLTFTSLDSQAAQELIRCAASVDMSPSKCLETVMTLLVAAVSRHSFAYPYACMMARRYSAKLSDQIRDLKESHAWLKAHAETEWFSELLTQSTERGRDAISILSAGFNDWRIWAEWSELDSQLAQAVEAYLRPSPTAGSIGQILEQLIKAQISGNRMRNPFVYQDARMLTPECSRNLSSIVQILVNSHQWLTAHAETKWLAMFLDRSLQSVPGAVEVMEVG